MVSMNIQSLHSFLFNPLCTACVLAMVSLSSCDIVPVSVGTWDITIESSAGTSTGKWTIKDGPTLQISGTSEINVLEIDLAGSRITWSTDALDFGLPGGPQRVNFRGTVDGDRLAGTIFTQQGNFTVTGNRQ